MKPARNRTAEKPAFGFLLPRRALAWAGSIFFAATAYGEQPRQPGDALSAQPGIVLDRYREILFQSAPPAAAKVRELAKTLQADGRWPDIDYSDRTGSNWKLISHLSRLVTLAVAVKHPASAVREDILIKEALWRALDHWLEKRYQNPNWWHNQIGTPRIMRDVLVVLEPDLTPERRAVGWQIVAQSGRVGMTGANLIWLADLVIARASATGDVRLLADASKRAAAEIKITTQEGVQPDFSFHQHGARLQTFHYGRAYADNLIRLAWILRGTPWAFQEDKVSILADYVIEGMDWMRRGSYTVPATLDRATSRMHALGGLRLTPNLILLRDVLPDRADRMDAIIAREAGRGEPQVGFRHFPYSDFTVYHRKSFSVFLKTMSSRTLPCEQINNENLKGNRLYCSDSFFMRDGREYYNLMPVWDWFWLPGITIAAKLPGFERRSFVGGVGDGQSGLTAIDYRFGDVVTARKAWFFHGDRAICLIGDLRAPDHPHGSVLTALDQCRLDGPLTVGRGERLETIEKSGTLKEVSWMHHRGLAYLLLEPGDILLAMGDVSGSWRQISAGLPPDTVTDQVFRPLLNHGERPEGVSAGYVVAPAETAQAARALSENPGFKVLANGRDIQAVRFNDKVLMAAFYSAGSIDVGDRTLLSVDQSCLIMVKNGALWAANPEHRAKTIAVAVPGRPVLTVSVPSDGTAVRTSLQSGDRM